ncbi:MAG: PaaI family thioesterase [Candidatus Cloacimonadota bacterium]|nr:PaaI family thioesterase [Candidatus Cloacimonadota bacterium]
MSEKEYTKCFACGQDNPIGLKLIFDYKEDYCIAEFTLNQNYEGYPGIIHGGIVSTILDESMAKIILTTTQKAVTVEMKTKFRQMLESNKIYFVKAKITKERSRTVQTESQIFDKENNIVAQASAKFFKIV